MTQLDTLFLLTSKKPLIEHKGLQSWSCLHAWVSREKSLKWIEYHLPGTERKAKGYVYGSVSSIANMKLGILKEEV